jgi:hypothetical protein
MIRKDAGPVRARLGTELLEDRCVPAGTVTITNLTFPPAVEGAPASPSATATFTDTASVAASALTATIDYGDGTPLSTATVTQVGATTTYTVTDTHTYPDESGGLGFNATLHVFETANPATNTDTLSQRAVVGDAVLAAGALPAGVTHSEFSGVGGTATAGGALNALNAFKTAIGGVKNTAAAPQSGGFRVITWDGVAVDGTDFGGNTTVIVPNKTVGIPINRFQTQGSLFETIYAVSADGFQSVNPDVAAASPALFPSFSPTKTFAMFNDNTIDFSFILPSAANTAPVDAGSRGFGAIFENVRLPNTTSIEYFDGNISLGKFFVPTSNTQGDNEFLGELFSSPVVTRISITLGTDVLFSFNGTTFSAGGTDNPGGGHNLAVTDDFVYAEPVAAAAVQAPVNAVVGSLFNGAVATFTDANAGSTVHDFTGSINWGDGSTSPATFTAQGSGKFAVNGSHTYTSSGTFPVSILVQDFGGNDVTLSNTATVSGDAVVNGTAADDTLTLGRTPGGAVGDITFVLNGNSTALKGVTSFTFNGNDGNDSLTVSLTDGNPIVSGNVVYDGGNGTDAVSFAANGLPVVTTATGVTAGSQPVQLTNVETVNLPPPPGGLVGRPRDLSVGGSAGGTANVYTPSATGQYANPPARTTPAGIFPGFTGEIRTATGDFNGDGVEDTVLVTGPGTRTAMAIINGKDNTVLLQPSDPFGDPNFTSGGFVTAGDIDHDGKAEWVVTPELRGGPRVVIFGLNANGTTRLVANFFGIQDDSFRDGARAALGDVNGDGMLDVFCIAAFNGGPRTAVFDGKDVLVANSQNRAPNKLTGDFFATTSGQDEGRGGRSIAAGDVNGDGVADLIVSGDNLLGTGNRVTIFSGADLIAGRPPGGGATVLADFAVGGQTPQALVSLTTVDADADNRADLAVGSGPGQASLVKVYLGKNLSGTTEPTSTSFDPFGTVTTNGVFVG